MTLSTYSDLTAAIDSWLGHSLFDAQASTFVQLFESTANRRLLTRQQEKIAILVPSNPAQIAVTGATASTTANSVTGGFLIRIACSTTLLSTGVEVNISNIAGTTEANASWIVTVIDSGHIDLQSSTFTNAYQSGGTVQTLVGIATLPSDYLAWRRVTWTGQTRLELSYVAPDYFEATFPTQPTDTPRFFMIEGSTLSVIPVDATPLEMDYFASIPSLSANSTNWLFTAHPDIYLFGSLAEAENFGINDERFPMWKARRDEVFEEITKLDLRTRGPSAVRVFGPTP